MRNLRRASQRATTPNDEENPLDTNVKRAVSKPAIARKLGELKDLLDLNDDRTRLLFHLDQYVSLVYYNPDDAKKDKSFEWNNWRPTHDLWRTVAANQDPERVRRVQAVYEEYKQAQQELEQTQEPARKGKQTPKKRAKSVQVKEEEEPSPKRAKRAPASASNRRTSRGRAKAEEVDPVIIEIPKFTPSKSSGPAPKVTHPIHRTEPKHGGDLDALLGSYRLLDDGEVTDTAYDAMVASQVYALKRVNAARESGLLQQLQRIGAGLGKQAKFVDPGVKPTHTDHLVAHAVYLGKLRQRHRKLKAIGSKKTAQTVEQYFKRLAGQEEKDRKDQERLLKQMARRVGNEVLKKWKLAEKVVFQRRQQVLEEENRVKGKQYLNKILEQSAQLLESRLEPRISELDGSESDDDEDLSSDGSVDKQDDITLSVEELREKYKHLADLPADSDDEDEDEDLDDDADADEDVEDTSLRISNDLASQSEIESDPDQSAEEVESEEASEEEAEGEAELDFGKPSKEALELYKNAKFDDEESEDDSMSDSDQMSDSEGSAESDGLESGNNEPVPSLASIYGGDHDEDDDAHDDEVQSDFESPRDSITPDSDHADGPTNGSVKEIKTEDAVASSEENEEDPAGGDVSMVDAEAEVEEVSGELVPHVEKQYNVETPFLLRGTLREYQRDGLDWLVGLYNSETNGILADEMGLGKTIQTIALLAHLACEKHIWGPHLIIVPTSVMLNWEMEFKRFAPGFKVLTYYGNPQQRKDKRRGWNKEDTWHVCITSYQLVIQDQVAFKRKRWEYMILDEAHNIKNFRSQRWQSLLNFNSERRLLLTGTPLQNNLVELWSLLYFLMPSSKGSEMMPKGFANLEDFQEWFARPVDQMVEEGNEADDESRKTIAKLHQVLRPYLLRRLKRDVEKQMPGKYEHIVYCRLSKRQRYLYDDFMARAATKETLASGNFMSILNCLMQLRKVCNHPDLFEVHPVVTSLALDRSAPSYFKALADKFTIEPEGVDLSTLNLLFPKLESDPKNIALAVRQYRANMELALELAELAPETVPAPDNQSSLEEWARYNTYRRRMERSERLMHSIYLNMFRTAQVPLYGSDLRDMVTLENKVSRARGWSPQGPEYDWAVLPSLQNLVLDVGDREAQLKPVITRYSFVTPRAVCLDQPELSVAPLAQATDFELVRQNPEFHESQVRLSIAFPDKQLLQYDCGKLQRLAVLLRDLIDNGHRVLIFTQMTKVLDILEQFLNIHGWRYMRLDGATRIEQRQVLTERFNNDSSTPVFILSTRSGGLGINLTGADTVIFYDSDWNPAMDKQCQDRCHRIGQTRDVHIYRLVSEFTIESNILRKATQKTILDNVVIQEGDFTTDYFNKLTVQDLLGDNAGRTTSAETLQELGGSIEALAQAEDEDDRTAANMAMTEVQLDIEDFEGASKGDSKPTSRSDTPAAAAKESEEISEQDLTGIVASAPGEPEVDEDGIGHIDDYMIRAVERGDFISI